MKNEQCTRSDLRGVINTPSYWDVDNKGRVDFTNYYVDGIADAASLDGYYCDCCDEFFETWTEATSHLPKVAA